jgi:hypothetical protein
LQYRFHKSRFCCKLPAMEEQIIIPYVTTVRVRGIRKPKRWLLKMIPIVICRRCGRSWPQDQPTPPKYCRNRICRSPDWNKPRRYRIRRKRR